MFQNYFLKLLVTLNLHQPQTVETCGGLPQGKTLIIFHQERTIEQHHNNNNDYNAI